MENINLGTAQMLGSRQDQQDAYGISDKDDTGFVEYGGVLAVIADGIGGHAHGAEASHKGVGAFIRHYQVNPQKPNIPQALFHALIHANRAVLEFAESQGEAENCGTTLLAVALHPNSSALYWISVGDSRMYFWRDGELALFTADANYGSHLIKKFARGTASRDDLYAEFLVGQIVSGRLSVLAAFAGAHNDAKVVRNHNDGKSNSVCMMSLLSVII